MRTLLLLLAASSTLLACSSSSSDGAGQAEGEENAGSSTTKLVCDRGAASLQVSKTTMDVVSVDQGSATTVKRRSAEFVISDRGVVDYLSSKVAHLVQQNQTITVRGSVPEDGSFDWFENWESFTSSSRQESNQVRIDQQIVPVVHRVQGDPNGVRVVYNTVTQRKTCSTYWEENHCAFDQQQNKPGQLTTDRSDAPIADWVFHCAGR